MNKEVQDFLGSHTIGCLATQIQVGVHAATVHYTLTKAGHFYVQTNLDSRKCELLRSQSSVAASFVVGFSEDEWKTFQADGTVRLLTDPTERKQFVKTRLKQYPGTDYSDDPEVAFLEFTPTWWRYSDLNTKPPTIIENQ